MNKQEVSAKSQYTDEFEEDLLSGLEIPTGINNLYLRSSRDVDVITPLSEDFIATPVPSQPVQDSDPMHVTAFFASREEHNFIVIMENEVHRNVIDEIRMDGWDIKFSVPDKLSDISEIIGLKQFSERFGVRISHQEPSIHKLKKHKDEDDDDHHDDQTGNNGRDINIISQLLTSSTIDNSQSSDQTQKTSSSQSDTTTSQAVLAIGIAIGSIAYYTGGYALSNLDSNPIIESFKNSFLEQLDYYL